MKKRCVGFLLACVMLLGLLPMAHADAASLNATPNLNLTYEFSDSAQAGTIRYVSQLSASPNFHASYWNDYVDAAGWECYTACISMALSSVGADATPGDLGDYWNEQQYTGGDPFTTMAWDVRPYDATFLQRSFATSMDNLLSHPGSYSPPIIHLTTYSERGHYVLVAGKLSENTYLVVDPANDEPWKITIENNVATYIRHEEERTEELEMAVQYYRSAGALAQTPSAPQNVPAASIASAGHHADGTTCSSAAMTDVPAETNWAHAGIDFCISKGLMNGVSATQFNPSGDMTRAMLVTVLYRAAGEPDVSGVENVFEDLGADWYRNAVAWAYKTGVTSGVSSTRFAPSDQITREQLVSMLYRYRQLTGATPSEISALDNFWDAGRISGYAMEAMRWAVTNGLITGTASDTLSPGGAATRAQLASILMRYMSL